MFEVYAICTHDTVYEKLVIFCNYHVLHCIKDCIFSLKFIKFEPNGSFIHVVIRILDNIFNHSENKMKNYTQKHNQHENRKVFSLLAQVREHLYVNILW